MTYTELYRMFKIAQEIKDDKRNELVNPIAEKGRKVGISLWNRFNQGAKKRTGHDVSGTAAEAAGRVALHGGNIYGGRSKEVEDKLHKLLDKLDKKQPSAKTAPISR